jgi:hypothetical protein
MTHTKKLSAILAVLAIGFFSIFADCNGHHIFHSYNHTQHELNITLNLKSGDQITLSIEPGQHVETDLDDWSRSHFSGQSQDADQVTGVTYNNQNDPAGTNAIMEAPSGGNTVIMWQMDGGTPVGFIGEPPTGTLS